MYRRSFLNGLASLLGLEALTERPTRQEPACTISTDTVRAMIYILDHARTGDRWMVVCPTGLRAEYLESLAWSMAVECKQASRRDIESNDFRPWTVSFKTRDGGRATLLIRRGDVPERLRGISFAGLWFDQRSAISEAAFSTALATLRMRGRTGPIIYTESIA